MKNKAIITVILLVLFVSGLAYFVFHESSKTIEQSENEERQKTSPAHRNLPTNLAPSHTVSAQTPLTSEEFSALKDRAAESQKELDFLAQELNKNMDDPKEKKRIQEKYKLKTQEYNKLVLQFVKQTKRVEQEHSK